MNRLIMLLLMVGYLYAAYWLCATGLGWLAFLLFVGQWYSNMVNARVVRR